MGVLRPMWLVLICFACWCCFKFVFCSFVCVSSVVLRFGLVVAWLLLMVAFSGFCLDGCCLCCGDGA